MAMIMVRDIKWFSFPIRTSEARLPPRNRVRQNSDRDRIEIRAIIIEDRAIVGGGEVSRAYGPSGSIRLAISLSGSERPNGATPSARHSRIVSQRLWPAIDLRAARRRRPADDGGAVQVVGVRTAIPHGTFGFQPASRRYVAIDAKPSSSLVQISA